jgi:hypothetical protein
MLQKSAVAYMRAQHVDERRVGKGTFLIEAATGQNGKAAFDGCRLDFGDEAALTDTGIAPEKNTMGGAVVLNGGERGLQLP